MNDWLNLGWSGPDDLTGFQIDYSSSRDVIRITYFEDGHFKDDGFYNFSWIFNIIKGEKKC